MQQDRKNRRSYFQNLEAKKDKLDQISGPPTKIRGNARGTAAARKTKGVMTKKTTGNHHGHLIPVKMNPDMTITASQ